MRKILLALAMALACSPVGAQLGLNGKGQRVDNSISSRPLLIGCEEVQKALALSKEQNAEIEKARKEYQDSFEELLERAKAMRKGGVVPRMRPTNPQVAYSKALDKVKATLTAAQKERLFGIEIQHAEMHKSLNILGSDRVATALKLSAKQKESVETLVSEYEKGIRNEYKEAEKDKERQRVLRQKLAIVYTDSHAKFMKILTEPQQKAWKELRGDEIRGILMVSPRFRPRSPR